MLVVITSDSYKRFGLDGTIKVDTQWEALRIVVLAICGIYFVASAKRTHLTESQLNSNQRELNPTNCVCITIKFIKQTSYKFQDTTAFRHTYKVQTLPDLGILEGPAQIKIEYTHGQLHAYIQGSPVQIQTPAHSNPKCRKMTARSPVLWPRSILPPPLSHCVSVPKTENPTRV